jgi:membrane-associated protein
MVWATHASSLASLLTPYCYASLVLVVLVAAAGAPVPTGAIFIGLGALSVQPQGPNFLALALLGTAAAVSGDVLDYGLGRAGRPVLYAWLLRPFLKFSGIELKDLTTRLSRGSGVMIFLTRFTLTPLASPLSILAGIVRTPLARFLAWDVPGDVVAVIGNLALGRWLGSGFTTHSSHVAAFWGVLAFAGVAPTLLFLPVPGRTLAPHRAPPRTPIGRAACERGPHLVASGSNLYQEGTSAATKSSMEADRSERCARLRGIRRPQEALRRRLQAIARTQGCGWRASIKHPDVRPAERTRTWNPCPER